MASVNGTSIREEIAHVEQEIARLSEAGKVSDESRVLFSTLLESHEFSKRHVATIAL